MISLLLAWISQGDLWSLEEHFHVTTCPQVVQWYLNSKQTTGGKGQCMTQSRCLFQLSQLSQLCSYLSHSLHVFPLLVYITSSHTLCPPLFLLSSLFAFTASTPFHTHNSPKIHGKLLNNLHTLSDVWVPWINHNPAYLILDLILVIWLHNRSHLSLCKPSQSTLWYVSSHSWFQSDHSHRHFGCDFNKLLSPLAITKNHTKLDLSWEYKIEHGWHPTFSFHIE